MVITHLLLLLLFEAESAIIVAQLTSLIQVEIVDKGFKMGHLCCQIVETLGIVCFLMFQ